MKIKFVSLWISALCIGMFILQQWIPGFTQTFLLSSSAFNYPYQLVTSLFLHGSLGHLISNLIALALFGTLLEIEIGSKRTLAIFFISGILANLVAMQFYPSSLGASGAIFGILGTLIILKPFMMVWAVGLPMPMLLAGAFWMLSDISGLFSADGVGHIAHLMGVVVGFAFGIFYYTKRPQSPSRRTIQIDEDSIQRWENQFMR